MKINVTQRDIEAGQRGNCNLCPGARAINRRLKRGLLVDVFPGTVRFYDGKFGGPLCSRFLPPEMTIWIRRFDNLLKVQPISFELDIPKNYVR